MSESKECTVDALWVVLVVLWAVVVLVSAIKS